MDFESGDQKRSPAPSVSGRNCPADEASECTHNRLVPVASSTDAAILEPSGETDMFPNALRSGGCRRKWRRPDSAVAVGDCRLALAIQTPANTAPTTAA